MIRIKDKSFLDLQRDKEIKIKREQYAKHKTKCEKNRHNRKKRK